MDPTWVNPDRNNLILAARFARNYGFRLTRFYRRASMTIRGVQALGGTAAFAALTAPTPADGSLLVWAAKILGLLLALASVVDIVWNPGDLASQCGHASKQWGELAGEANDLEDADLLRKVNQLYALDLPAWRSLDNPVFNDLMREVRHEMRLPMTCWNKFAAWLT